MGGRALADGFENKHCEHRNLSSKASPATANIFDPQRHQEIEYGGKQSMDPTRIEAMLQKQKKSKKIWRTRRRKTVWKFQMTFLLPTKVESFQSKWPRSTIFSND
jgi:hypothetical protein